jgi:hypothetical protein
VHFLDAAIDQYAEMDQTRFADFQRREHKARGHHDVGRDRDVLGQTIQQALLLTQSRNLNRLIRNGLRLARHVAARHHGGIRLSGRRENVKMDAEFRQFDWKSLSSQHDSIVAADETELAAGFATDVVAKNRIAVPHHSAFRRASQGRRRVFGNLGIISIAAPAQILDLRVADRSRHGEVLARVN